MNIRTYSTPHGFICFTATTAGSVNSFTMLSAASASLILLYDNCSAYATEEVTANGAL